MKKSTLVLSVLSLLLFATSCKKKISGEGPTVTKTRNVSDFSKVSFSIPGILYVTKEPGYKLTIDAQQNMLDIIETPVINGELKIRFQNNRNIGSHDKIIARVSAPLFHALTVSGVGDISANQSIQSSSLRLGVSGSGTIILTGIDISGKLDASISGSGTVQINGGNANEGDLSTSGSGDIETMGVTFSKAVARISGSGNIKASVTSELEAHIAGSGSIYYKGDPSTRTHISGSGTVKKVQ